MALRQNLNLKPYKKLRKQIKQIYLYKQYAVIIDQQMQKILSPNQFLFQQAILQVLKEAKKTIRVSPFENIEPQELVKNNNGNLYLDLYHHYLVAAMTNLKTKQLACVKYQKILRENLFDRDHQPPQMISSILSGCSNTGGSTTGSSHGSANISPSNQHNENLYVVNLVKTILMKTSQHSSQIQLALTYILEGSRNKRFATFYNSILEDIYNTLLVKIRQQPVKRLVHLQLNHICNQVQIHISDISNQWTIPKFDQHNKRVMCIHDQKGGKGKFGKCFVCGKEADNYCKDEMVPICSFECKYKLKEMAQAEQSNDCFNLMGWLIQSLPSGDQIIYSFLGRELPHHCLSLSQIISILKIIINVFTSCSAQRLAQHTASIGQPQTASSGHYLFKQIQKHSLNIFLHILFNYKQVYEKELAKYFKVFFFEIVRILQLISIKRLKLESKPSKGSKGELASSKQSLESSLNVSLDSMGNMQSMNNMAQNNPNLNTYLHYQQQFSNPFLNGIIQILSNEDLFFYIYSKFDCKFFQQSLLAKMMNIISQYAKEEIVSKQNGVGVTGSSAYGVYSILKMLTERVVGYEKHRNLRNFSLEEENRSVDRFLQSYRVNMVEVEMKRQLPKIIELFNKKPLKGIAALKKLFAKHIINNKKPHLQTSFQSPTKDSRVNQIQSQPSLHHQDPYQKHVEKIKKKAERLQRENLDASQLSVREDSIVSIDIMEEASGMEIGRGIEQVVEEMGEIKEGDMRMMKEESPKSIEVQEVGEKLEKPKEQEMQQKLQPQTILQKQKQQKQKKQQPLPNSTQQKQQPPKPTHHQQQIDSFITAKQIAMILRQNVDYDSKLKKIPLFHKQKVAEYMGSTKNKQANQICYEFFKLDEPIYSFSQIDDCLRTQFNYFGLPKQGQQIQIVIDELSKVMLPHTYFANALNIFQYIYTLLMVQSGHNPNCKESDKVKLEMFLSMVGHIEEVKGKAERDFHRIKKNSLNNLHNWGELIFEHKYLMDVEREDWLFDKLQEFNSEKQRFQQCKEEQQKQQKLSKLFQSLPTSPSQIINLKYLLQYIWQYVYISIVNNQKKNSTLGVFQAIVLYGKYGLVGEQFGFMQIFKRSYEYNKSKDSLQSLLRLGIEFNNYLYQWSYLISLSYVLQESNTYHQHIDKIFTNLQYVHKSKLKVFLVALCEFSTSEFKSDKGYNRELFVLRHITEILEYNLGRLEQVWDEIWGTIQTYFKSICLHPMKQISMAAIDSYKQLSLKIFKIKPKSHHNTIDHSRVLSTYLYIFERSNIFIKDLIINILQNVVSSDIVSGWEIIYEILNINDSEDKTVVMKVVERLVKEVGYKRLTALEKLHMILIKELRVNVGTLTLIEAILGRLWEVAQEIDEQETWVETLKSVKDIYKMSLNNKLLGFFFKICNRCIGDDVDEIQQRKRRESFDQMRPIIPKPQQKQQQQQIPEQKQQNQHTQSHYPLLSLSRQIYTQIIDWLVFLMDTKNDSAEHKQSYLLIVKEALDQFKELKTHYVIRYLTGVSGLLSVFSMFMNSEYKIVLLFFFRDFLREKLLGKEGMLARDGVEKVVELMAWVNEHFKQSIPGDLLAMKKLDEDFKKQRKDLIYTDDSAAAHISLPNSEIHKIQLIEFSLSAQDFNVKSISNLILLDCIELLVRRQTVSEVKKRIQETRSEKLVQKKDSTKERFENTLNSVYQNLLENYDVARKTNNLIALRNFLWNNGFLLYHTFKENQSQRKISTPYQQDNSSGNKLIDISKPQSVKFIPGLHKHETRSLQLILRELPDEDSYVLNLQVLEDFIVNYRLKVCLDEDKGAGKGLRKRGRQQTVNSTRKISEFIKSSQEAEGKQKNEKRQVGNCQNSQQLQKPAQQKAIPNKQLPQQPRPRNQSFHKQKQIQVIQYEAKQTKFTTNKPKVSIIPSSKSQKAQQNQQNMQQLYLNDVNQWLKTMQPNLQQALNNLLKVCSEIIDKKEQQKGEGREENGYFMLSDQEIVKIFLLCLDLTGEDNCGLGVMRCASSLMQRLLGTVMSVDIEYGFRDEGDESDRGGEGNE